MFPAEIQESFDMQEELWNKYDGEYNGDWEFLRETVLEPYEEAAHYEDMFYVGFDVKISPDGDPRLIELLPVGFSAKGLEEAFPYGGLGDREESWSRFSRYINRRKKQGELKDILGELMPERISEYSELEDERFVKKSVRVEGGAAEICESQVKFSGESLVVNPDLSLYSEPVLIKSGIVREEFVPSKPIPHEGDEYDACMRYVMRCELEEDKMKAVDMGGYWRTASKPLSSGGSLQEKYLANYTAGSAVAATRQELEKASDISAEAMKRLYQSWTESKSESMIGQFADSVDYLIRSRV